MSERAEGARPTSGGERAGPGTDGTVDGAVRGATCDYCGAEALAWRKCKLICGNCRQINKSCADL